MKQRRIIHIDMDCFYAAIECRDDPSVADKPVGVGGSSGRGVLTTCNYIAREFGCRSAMPVFKARELCPHLVLKPVRFEVYRAEARRIRAIFRAFTDRIEPLSLDEAYLDVTDSPGYAWDIAKEIRRRIRAQTRLTASAGIAPNKMLAKIASDWRKPDGQFAVTPERVEAFVRDLPVRKLWGVGPKSAERLAAAGVETCGQLQAWSLERMCTEFGMKWGAELYALCRGEDGRPVETDRRRKSLSTEQTFERNLDTFEACRAALLAMLPELEADLARAATPYRKVFVKVKFADFRSTTCERAAAKVEAPLVEVLLREAFERSPHAVRLLGVGVRFVEPPGADPAQIELPFAAAP